jgi:hypothetical protein
MIEDRVMSVEGVLGKVITTVYPFSITSRTFITDSLAPSYNFYIEKHQISTRRSKRVESRTVWAVTWELVVGRGVCFLVGVPRTHLSQRYPELDIFWGRGAEAGGDGVESFGI